HLLSLLSLESRMDASFRRTWNDIRNNSVDTYVLWSIERGALRSTQSVNTRVTPAGSLTMLSSNRAFLTEVLCDPSHPFKSKIAIIPGHILRSYVPDCQDFLNIDVKGNIGEGRIVRDLLELLFDEGDTIAAEGNTALTGEMLRALQRLTRDPSLEIRPRLSQREQQLKTVQDTIDFHFTDPDLSSATVAKKCGISVRYLYYLLETAGVSFSKFIWSKRLSKASEWLHSDEMKRYTISEIAYMVGFKSAAHFSRAFRKQFGCTPQAHRASRTTH
ncbi:MAG: helix-turn-helix domain-containing protein, partial [Sphingomonadaceae bacterium]